jgi:hypothetical protein
MARPSKRDLNEIAHGKGSARDRAEAGAAKRSRKRRKNKKRKGM